MLDGFWQTRLATNRDVTIPHILKQNEATGRVANFVKAARTRDRAVRGPPLQRYRRLQGDRGGVVFAGRHAGSARSTRELDRLIALIAAAQEPDGYLYPARTIDPEHPAPGAGPDALGPLNGSHELYNSGHLYEAAVAHYQATGKRSLLDVAIKNANLVCSVFGPDGRRAVPGHEEIELALDAARRRSPATRATRNCRDSSSISAASRTSPSRIRTVRSRCTTAANTSRIICRSSNRIAPSVTPCARPISTPA